MNPLAIFAGPYAVLARWGVIAALVGAFGLFAWVKGNQHGTQKLTDYIGKQAVETVRLTEARVQIVRETEIRYQTRIVKVFEQGKTIEKEVTKYVTQKDDAGCNIPVGFVREYDAAWTNAPAAAPADADRGPSGIPLSAVAEADARNATACRSFKAQRDGLIELYRNIQRAK